MCIANVRQNVTSRPDQVNYSSYLLRNPYWAEHAVTHIWLSAVQKEQAVRRMRGPLKATAHKLQCKPRRSGAKACHTQGRAQSHAAKSWYNFNQQLKIKRDVPYCHWYFCPTYNVCVCLPFLEMSSSTSCMKLATSGGSLWISLSLRPSFRRFSSLKKGCKDRQ